jgi:mannan endo-1,4-beta-mannosidase
MSSDEGYYNWPNNTDYIYNGTSGMDFEVNLKIDTIDFGTFHLYPQSWAEYPIDTWGTNYIQQHINSQSVSRARSAAR